MNPTEKQLKFIEEICDVLDLENPNCQTRQETYLFIHDNIEEYKMTIDELKDTQGLFVNGYFEND